MRLILSFAKPMNPKRRHLMLIGLLLPTALTFVAEGVVSVIFTPFASALHVPAALFGLLFTLHRLVRIAATPAIGIAADRIGRRPLLLLGVLCGCLSLFVLSFAHSPLPLFIARMLYGLASGLLINVGSISLLDIAKPNERGGMLGLQQAAVYGLVPLGTAAGGFMVARLGESATFLICGGVVFFSLLIAALVVPETRGEGAQAGFSLTARTSFKDYPRLLRGNAWPPIALKMISGFALWGVFEATVVLYFLKKLGKQSHLLGLPMATQEISGLFLSALYVVGFLVGSPVAGRLADRSGKHLLFVQGSLVLTALSLVGLSMARGAESLGLLLLGLGVATALITTPSAALVGHTAPKEERAALMSAFSTLSDIGCSLGAVVGAALSLRIGFEMTYMGTAVGLVVALICIRPGSRTREGGGR